MRNHPSFATIFLICLAGCAAPTHWHLESIVSQDPSSRLIFSPEDRLAGLGLEFCATQRSISSYVTSYSRELSKHSKVKSTFRFGEDSIEVDLELHDGLMRARLPDTLSQKMIQTLQAGQAFTIIVDSLEQTFQPEQFAALFNRLNKTNLLESLKGPLE